jgi:hypothetical protein
MTTPLGLPRGVFIDRFTNRGILRRVLWKGRTMTDTCSKCGKSIESGEEHKCSSTSSALAVIAEGASDIVESVLDVAGSAAGAVGDVLGGAAEVAGDVIGGAAEVAGAIIGGILEG